VCVLYSYFLLADAEAFVFRIPQRIARSSYNVPGWYASLLAVLQNHLASNEQATVFSSSDYSDDDDNETHSHVDLFRI
jgi:hypothetical protein